MSRSDPSALDSDLDIEKIFRSAAFTGKDQPQRLLQILFRYKDRQATLKPDRVILELWGEKSNTRTPANLATEMNRLRRLLDSYYAIEGAEDAVRIELPTRSTGAAKPGIGLWISVVPAGRAIEVPVTPQERALDNSSFGAPMDEAEPENTLQSRLVAPTRFQQRRFVWAMVTVCSILLLAVTVLLYRAAHPGVPQGMHLDGKFLRVVDSEGNELWHQFFPDGFWAEYYGNEARPHVLFADLDGSGKVNVVFAYHPANDPTTHNSTLICYSDRGKEKWRWTPGRSMAGLGLDPSYFKIVRLDLLKSIAGAAPRVVVSANHHLYYPHQIALLSGEGKLVSEYWHSGHLDWVTLADLDGDGRQEILASGVSNGYHQATLVVLDPDRMQGASVERARPAIQIPGLLPAQERARILFPRTDLGMLTIPYNVALNPVVDGKVVGVTVHDLASNSPAEFFYRFDRSLRLENADVADGFRQNHDAYYRNAPPQHQWSPQEEARLSQITCLSGCEASHQILAANSGHSPAR